jgi:hypothetical protein
LEGEPSEVPAEVFWRLFTTAIHRPVLVDDEEVTGSEKGATDRFNLTRRHGTWQGFRTRYPHPPHTLGVTYSTGVRGYREDRNTPYVDISDPVLPWAVDVSWEGFNGQGLVSGSWWKIVYGTSAVDAARVALDKAIQGNFRDQFLFTVKPLFVGGNGSQFTYGVMKAAGIPLLVEVTTPYPDNG